MATHPSAFGELLRRYRRTAALSQEALAERAGVGADTVRALERGRSGVPRTETLARLAEALGLDAEARAVLTAAARPEGSGSVPDAALLEAAVAPAGDRQDGEIAPEPKTGADTSPGARAAQPARTNLPLALTSFIGREREQGEVQVLLEAARLVTLTGTGGCGKTRLALEVAATLVAAFPDGVWLVELAALADPLLMPNFVANALGVREVPGRSVATTLVEHLRSRHLLLVLDNCEHLIDACAALVETLILSCPRLWILATSREALGTSGESIWPVAVLSIPDLRVLPSSPEPLVAEVTRYEAVRLFVDRARLGAPSFAAMPGNATTLARICQRLDGLPLAIELAAARVKLLALEQIAERLDDCFELLSAGRRTATTRHRTLWATIDWSYDLLAEPEQVLFRRLSVFAGGFGLDAAQAVCGASLALLGLLVDKSLVLVDQPTQGAARYHLLETIRQYSGEKLRAAGETVAARCQHARYFLSLAETAEPWLTSRERERWVLRLDAEHDNLRAAIGWSQQEGGEIEVGLRLAGALWWFWNLRSYLSEARAHVEAVLAHPGAQGFHAERAKALTSAGAVTWLLGDYVAARASLTASVALWRSTGDQRGLAYALILLALTELRAGEQTAATTLASESVAHFREASDPWGLAWALNNLGYITSSRGDYANAHARLTESLDRFRQLADRWGIALALSNLGYLAYRLGDYPRARDHLEESMAIFRALDHYWTIPRTLNSLGNIARCQGEHERAAQLYEQCLRLCQEHDDHVGIAVSEHNLAQVARAAGDLQRAADLFVQSLGTFHAQGHRHGVADCLVGLAGVAAMGGRPEQAARLFGAGMADREHGGLPLSPVKRAEAERDLAVVQRALDPAAFAAAWQSGQALTLEQAIEDALIIDLSQISVIPRSASRVASSASPLTRREEEVVHLIVRGRSNRQIADELIISERTADSHVSHILTKLGFTSRAQIAVWAVEHAQDPHRGRRDTDVAAETLRPAP
jgi:non-specific serine/threonine protein kinase